MPWREIKAMLNIAAHNYGEIDIDILWDSDWDNQIIYSDGILRDWSNDLKDIIFNDKKIENPTIKLQVEV